VISFTSEGNARGIVKASLMLGRSDLHVIEQTLVVRQDAEVRQYRFVETSFERRSPASVASDVFEPEPALIKGDVTGKRGKTESVPASPIFPVPTSPVVATPDLEFQVLKELNQADAFYGEQIGLSRTPEGQLRIEGIVETEKRKGEILKALSFVKRNPAVQIQVETVTEAAERQARRRSSPSGPIEVGDIEVEPKSAIPAELELRAYLSRLSGEALDQEIRHFADRVMMRTRKARRHALALKQIAERFSANDLRSLDESARNQWRQMIARHASGVEQELEGLRRELQPMFPSMTNVESNVGVEISSDADLARAAKRLFDLACAIDNGVGTSFSIYAGANATAPVRTVEFARALISAAALAQRIGRQ
jgi:hypothetical protein